MAGDAVFQYAKAEKCANQSEAVVSKETWDLVSSHPEHFHCEGVPRRSEGEDGEEGEEESEDSTCMLLLSVSTHEEAQEQRARGKSTPSSRPWAGAISLERSARG